MAYMKINEYTGKEYECHCDYSYTCNECLEIRREFAERKYREDLIDWLIDATKAIAKELSVSLPPMPTKQSEYD
jgi:hypothetical protein